MILPSCCQVRFSRPSQNGKMEGGGRPTSRGQSAPTLPNISKVPIGTSSPRMPDETVGLELLTGKDSPRSVTLSPRLPTVHTALHGASRTRKAASSDGRRRGANNLLPSVSQQASSSGAHPCTVPGTVTVQLKEEASLPRSKTSASLRKQPRRRPPPRNDTAAYLTELSENMLINEDTGYPDDAIPGTITKAIKRFDRSHKRVAGNAHALLRALHIDGTSLTRMSVFDVALDDLRRNRYYVEEVAAPVALELTRPLRV